MKAPATPAYRRRFSGPGAWRAADFVSPADWTHRLTAADLSALEQDRFPAAARISAERFEGRGFVV